MRFHSHEPRIEGGCSMHAAYDTAKCPNNNEELRRQGFRCGVLRCVDCCKQEDGRDVVECSRCGFQQAEACTFDDEYS